MGTGTDVRMESGGILSPSTSHRYPARPQSKPGHHAQHPGRIFSSPSSTTHRVPSQPECLLSIYFVLAVSPIFAGRRHELQLGGRVITNALRRRQREAVKLVEQVQEQLSC